MRAARIVALLLLCMLTVTPLYFMAIGSLQNIRGIMRSPPHIIPPNASLENYRVSWTRETTRSALNTLWMGAVAVSLSLVVNASAAYAFSVLGSFRLLYRLLLISLLTPAQVFMIPLFVTCTRLLRLPPWLSGVAPHLLVVPMLLYAKAFFDGIPRETIEAARLDGAGEWRILVMVVANMSRPIVAFMGISTFAGFCLNMLWQFLVLQRSGERTMIVQLYIDLHNNVFGGNLLNPLGRQMAVGMIILVPILILYLVANKYIVSLELRVEMGEK